MKVSGKTSSYNPTAFDPIWATVCDAVDAGMIKTADRATMTSLSKFDHISLLQTGHDDILNSLKNSSGGNVASIPLIPFLVLKFQVSLLVSARGVHQTLR